MGTTRYVVADDNPSKDFFRSWCCPLYSLNRLFSFCFLVGVLSYFHFLDSSERNCESKCWTSKPERKRTATPNYSAIYTKKPRQQECLERCFIFNKEPNCHSRPEVKSKNQCAYYFGPMKSQALFLVQKAWTRK